MSQLCTRQTQARIHRCTRSRTGTEGTHHRWAALLVKAHHVAACRRALVALHAAASTLVPGFDPRLHAVVIAPDPDLVSSAVLRVDKDKAVHGGEVGHGRAQVSGKVVVFFRAVHERHSVTVHVILPVANLGHRHMPDAVGGRSPRLLDQ